MDLFDKYVSASSAATGNQTYCKMNDGETITARIYFQTSIAGKHDFVFLMCNSTDSTFADGSYSQKNRYIKPFEIIEARVGVCETCDNDKAITPIIFSDVSFDGKFGKTIAPGELFFTDEFRLRTVKGDYICFEFTFTGKEFPYHAECNIPTFKLVDGEFVPSPVVPIPCMLGVDLQVKKRITFWGDSITQGIGTPKNSYEHYSALIADALGTDYAVWDIGLGFARASDAASNGVWMYKAKQCDIISVCFGVNDIFHDSAETVCKNLQTIVTELKNEGIKVLVQTVPPFDWSGECLQRWLKVNDFIRTTLAPQADAFFDNTAILGTPDAPNLSLYGSHPNSVGHKLWAEALLPVVKSLL